jgi:hypothetical protein
MIHVSPLEQNKYIFISSILDYNDIATQIYRLHTFSRGYKGRIVLISTMMRILNRWMRKGHNKEDMED